jgi:SecD/SecF fusion protein
MQNRSAIWVFTILLTIACIYQLSFSWVTSGFEDKANAYANGKLAEIENEGNDIVVLGRDTIFVDGELTNKNKEDIKMYFYNDYVTANGDESIYLGMSYNKCRTQQLSKGLDLQGGLSVTLEMSIPDLVKNKAGNSEKLAFTVPYEQAKTAFAKGEGSDFIDLFFEAYAKSEYKNDKMTFFIVGSPNDFKMEMSTEDIKSKLKDIAAKAVEDAEENIRKRISRFGMTDINISKQPISGRLNIEIPGVKDVDRMVNLLQKEAKLEFWDGLNANLLPAFTSLNKIDEGNDLADKKEKIDPITFVPDSLKNYLVEGTELATAQDSLNKQLADSILLANTVAEVEDVDDEDDLLGEDAQGSMFGGRFTFMQQPGQNNIYSPNVGVAQAKDTAYINVLLGSTVAKSYLPMNAKFAWSYKQEDIEISQGKKVKGFVLYAMDTEGLTESKLSGENIVMANYSLADPTSRKVTVNMSFDDDATATWSTWTGNKVNHYIGILMDNAVYSFPVIQSQITGGNTQISGNFTIDEAKDLSSVLRAGALPAPAIVVDKNIVGPTLGAENVSKSILSFVIAFVLVLIYMIFYYSKAGLVSGVALIANIFFIFGTLASLGASLTLPGIAGLVLTIGMSVDANVLIFERIREELRSGKGIKLAIADGYKNAYSAILDANVTSILTAIILAYFGSGPIQNFATTLIIGVFSSLFASIFVTRLIFSHMLDRKMAITFSISQTEKFLSNVNFDFVRKSKIAYVVSGAVIIIGLVSLFTNGLDKSIEFTGGRTYVLEFTEKVDRSAVEKAVSEVCIVEGKQVKPIVKTVNNSDYQFEISTKYYSDVLSKDADAHVDSIITVAMNNLSFVRDISVEAINNPELAKFTIVKNRSVNAQISNELITTSIIAIILSLIVVFIYIAFRFKRWQFGLGALIAMFHDVVVVLGLFSLLYKFMPFSMEIDQAFIAAILTVIGYSINDTVVIYDRIREYVGLHKRDEQSKVVNSALNSTLSRTINTSLTTFVVLLIIFLFGGDSIAGFAFALMIGIVVGTYSSLFIAAPSVLKFSKNIMPVANPEKQ